MGPLTRVRPYILHIKHQCWVRLLLLLPLLLLCETLVRMGAHALALHTLTTNAYTLTADEEPELRLGSYLHKYRGLSWLFIGMWREYEKLDISLRHLLWDYSLAMGQEKYRQLVKTLAQKEMEAETVLGQQRGAVIEKKDGAGESPQHSRLRRRPQARRVGVAIAAAMRLREVKQQLGWELKQLQRLLNQKEFPRVLDSIDFLDDPVNIRHALQVDNAGLFYGSLHACIDWLEALEKIHRRLTKSLKGLKKYVPSREDVLLHTLEVGNLFDIESPMVLHVPPEPK